MSVSHLTPDEAERAQRIYDALRQPPTATSESSPRSWPPSPTTSSSGRPSSRSATWSTRSALRPSRPPSRSGKKGVPRLQPELPGVPRVGPLRRLSPQGPAEPHGDHPPAPGLLSLPPLRPGHDPLGRCAHLVPMVAPGPPRSSPWPAPWTASPRPAPGGARWPGSGLGIDRGAGERGDRPGHRPSTRPTARSSARRGRGAGHKGARGRPAPYVVLDLTGRACGAGAVAAPGGRQRWARSKTRWPSGPSSGPPRRAAGPSS